MKLQLRLVVVMVIALLAMAGILVAQHQFALSGSNKVLSSELAQRKTYFNSVLGTDQEQLNSLARDYSFWDDMVDFTKTRDLAFAHANIDTSLSTYGADVAWVYGVTGNVIYDAQADVTKPLPALGLPQSFISQLQRNKFAHFFTRDNGELIEVRAATIVSGTDPAHTQPAAGYWIVARHIDQDYLTNLASLSQSSNILLTPTAADPPTNSQNNVNFTTPLLNWDGSVAAKLETTYDVPLLTDLNRSYTQQLVQVAILGSILILVVSAVLYGWVLRPVNRIISSIAARHPSNLDTLSHSRSEFGRLARTVQEFYEQKDKIAEQTIRSAALEQMNKEKTAFLSIAAHELKGPSGIVHMITEDLPHSAPKMTPAQLNEELETVAQQSIKMTTIINDLQLASQGDSNTKLEYHPEIVDFDHFLKREIAANQIITDQRLHFTGGTRADVVVDPIRLSQVVTNLIRNASKYSPGTEKIDISSHARGSMVTLRIRDFGIGISKSDQAKIFERFYRASNVTGKFQGLGIGLSICKANVTEFGGTITVQSELGKGSTFTVELPVVQK